MMYIRLVDRLTRSGCWRPEWCVAFLPASASHCPLPVYRVTATNNRIGGKTKFKNKLCQSHVFSQSVN